MKNRLLPVIACFIFILAFAGSVSAQSKNWYGKWSSNDTRVVLTISNENGKIAIKAVDSGDGEELMVHDVKVEGKELHYTLYTPSTSYEVTSTAVLKGKKEFQERIVGDGDETVITYHKEK